MSKRPFPRMKTSSQRFFIRVVKPKKSDCWEWIGALHHATGYGQFWFENKMWQAHRVSYIFCYGRFHLNLHVLHKCDNRKCVNPKHLFLGTDLDNARDCVQKGRKVTLYGNQVSTSKLTLQNVKRIKRLERDGKLVKRKEARKLGVSDTLIRYIVKGIAWPHVTI